MLLNYLFVNNFCLNEQIQFCSSKVQNCFHDHKMVHNFSNGGISINLNIVFSFWNWIIGQDENYSVPGLSETYLRLCVIQILKMANIIHTLITLHNL